MPCRIPARFSDTIQLASSRSYALQLHLVLGFAERLSTGRLERALRRVLDREPVLGCRFVPHWRRPYWERLDAGELARDRLLGETDGDPAALARETFLAEGIDTERAPQLKALLAHAPQGDTLILKVNHQVVDAGGTKELGALLADEYRRAGSAAMPDRGPNLGSRSLRQVYGLFSAGRLARVFAGFFREVTRLTRPFPTLAFPTGMEESGSWSFTLRRFSAERVRAFRSFCQGREATLNDLFVAALFRAIADFAGWSGDSTLRMISTVDLRRYLPGRRAEALCNLSGFFYPNLGRDLGKDLDGTVRRVKTEIDEEKRRVDFGLGSLFGDWVLIGAAPFAVQRLLMDSTIRRIAASRNIVPALTNLGPIEEEALDFGDGIRPATAEILVPPFRPPFFGVGLSGYRGGLTLSVGYFPSAVPAQRIEAFFDRLDSILPS